MVGSFQLELKLTSCGHLITVPVRVPMHKFKEAYTTLCYSFLCGVFVDVVV